MYLHSKLDCDADLPVQKLLGTPATHRSSWERFREYASLVRKITIDPSIRALDFRAPGKLRQETFWSQVSSALDDEPILPRLEAATLFSLNPFALFDFDMGALCLLTPSMRELNVICPGVGPAERSNFRAVLSVCLPCSHDLEVLSVVVPVSILEVEALPQQYPRLRSLKVDEDGIEPDQLALLATLPNLEHLSIVLSPYAPLDRPITFPELRSLDVFSYDFAGVGLLVAHLNAPKLRSISISEAHGGCDKTYSQTLFQHLSTLATRHSALSAFRWVSRDSDSFVPAHAHTRRAETTWTLAALLAPLLSALPAMRRFSASFTLPPIPCSALDFEKVAEAWQGLEEFSLSVSGCGGRGVEPGLESLAVFARHCPRLRTLRIPSVKFDPDDAAASTVQAGPHSELRELRVGNAILASTEFEEATRQGKVLRGLMRQIFPSAKISFPVRASLGRSRREVASVHEGGEDGEEDDEDEDEDEDEEDGDEEDGDEEDEDIDSADGSGSENTSNSDSEG